MNTQLIYSKTMNEGNWLFVLFFPSKEKQTSVNTRRGGRPLRFLYSSDAVLFSADWTKKQLQQEELAWRLHLVWHLIRAYCVVHGYAHDSLSSISLSFPNSAFHRNCSAHYIFVVLLRPRCRRRRGLLKVSNPLRWWLVKTRDLMA